MKDPAVLFYTGDFLTGCACLTMEERGQYITLLCMQHQIGHLSEKSICLSVAKASEDVMRKFARDENGLFYNERMEEEIIKRAKYIDSRRVNGKKGGEKNKAYAKASAKHTLKRTEDENINENIINNRDDNRDKINMDFVEKKFSDIFAEWLDYKKERGQKYKSDRAVKQCYSNLVKISNGDPLEAEKIIKRSIGNNWAGLFALDNKDNKHSFTKELPKQYEKF